MEQIKMEVNNIYKLIASVQDPIHLTYLEVSLTDQEFNTLLRLLQWMRETQYGSFHVDLNTYTQKSTGRTVKAIDIAPTQKHRVELGAPSSL